MKFTKLNYCQYLLSSQINYTITNLAEHLSNISHYKINYYLKNEKLTPRLLWDNVKDLIVPDEDAYIIFDDTVLMDTWYAANNLMLYIDSLDKVYYCPLKTNRLVGDSFGKEKYKNIESLEWSNEDLECGKIIKIKRFPAEKKVKLFRVTISG